MTNSEPSRSPQEPTAGGSGIAALMATPRRGGATKELMVAIVSKTAARVTIAAARRFTNSKVLAVPLPGPGMT